MQCTLVEELEGEEWGYEGVGLVFLEVLVVVAYDTHTLIVMQLVSKTDVGGFFGGGGFGAISFSIFGGVLCYDKQN